MYELVRAVASTVTIDKEGVKENPEEYVLPLSNTVSVNEKMCYNQNSEFISNISGEIYGR